MPKDFVVYGQFRGRAITENQARPLAFARHRACEESHTDVVDVKKGGRHASVACEACHGALAKHAADPTETAPGRPDGRTTCLVCHTASVTKPAAFPQIDPDDHGEAEPCTTCPRAHSPLDAPGAPAAETRP